MSAFPHISDPSAFAWRRRTTPRPGQFKDGSAGRAVFADSAIRTLSHPASCGIRGGGLVAKSIIAASPSFQMTPVPPGCKLALVPEGTVGFADVGALRSTGGFRRRLGFKAC